MINLSIKKLTNKLYRFGRKAWKDTLHSIKIFRDEYQLPDTTHVVKYGSDANGLNYNDLSPQRRRLHNRALVQVSLIACIKNEFLDVDGWFDRVINQTRLPNEIIIVDGGSTDGTKEKLEFRANHSRIPVQLFVNPGGNIAQNRNLAVKEARFPVIAVTDFGCFPREDWLEKIIMPFEMDDQIVVSGGTYDPISRTKKYGRDQKKLWYWSSINDVDPQDYLPPGGSIAYLKESWSMVGGYPEWLTLTGEDTYFDLELKSCGGKWAFTPEAVVEWIAPDTLGGYLKKVYQWAIGDGESGVRARYIGLYTLRLLLVAGSTIAVLAAAALFVLIPVKPIFLWVGVLLAAYLLGIVLLRRATRLTVSQIFQKSLGAIAQLAGFFRGAGRRKQVELRRLASLKGFCFVLSGVPLDDTGGGARCTQITMELLKRGLLVVYISKFPRYESKDLNIRFAHPNLFIYPLAGFNWEKFQARYHNSLFGKPVFVLVEFPIPEFLPLIQKIKAESGVVIYDLLDDWQTSLGGSWYSEAAEMEIIKTSDILLATAPFLQTRLSEVSHRKVSLVPNAVNDALFNPAIEYEKPKDMPEAARIIIYIGALWGDWFDWDLLEQIAARDQTAALCIIGDYRGQYKDTPSNIYFLGLKSQTELPAYLYHSDLAIIPWKVNKTTRATSPIKLYEYLAMHLPVVAPPLNTLEDIPGVMLAGSQAEFIRLVSKAGKTPNQAADLDSFIKRNNWSSRVTTILKLVEEQKLAVHD